MAFKDITKVLYDGEILLNYIDKSHYYGVRERVNFDLPVEDKKAWGKSSRPKGTTTLLGDTLEKKGLMTWPMGMALSELFGFYNFNATDENGKEIKLTGFSKEKGTLWSDPLMEDRITMPMTEEELLPVVKSASENYLRLQKKGADIGSVVHDAIEHYVLVNPNKLEPVFFEKKVPALDENGKNILDEDGDETFNTEMVQDFNKDGSPKMEIPAPRPSGFDIQESYMWSIKDSEYETEADKDQALEDFKDDTAMAELAFNRFVQWWTEEQPELLAAEQLVYSRKNHISGTFDALIRWNGKVYLTDWKTSKASKSKEAAMPEGINYQYFIQDAIYAMALEEEGSLLAELGIDGIDGLMVVSCRKDGGFTALNSEEVGLTYEEVLDWAESVIASYKFATIVKRGLNAHAEGGKDE